MTHRYLDIRTENFQKRLKLRAKIVQRMREFLDRNYFTEIETPTLIRRTPGVREIETPIFMYQHQNSVHYL